MVHQLTALWYHSVGQKTGSVVLCRDPRGRHGDAVFFDTDIQARPSQIIERYGSRWSIEMTNRETKQLLGAVVPQCRTELSVIRSPMCAYWSYSFVVLWLYDNLPVQENWWQIPLHGTAKRGLSPFPTCWPQHERVISL